MSSVSPKGGLGSVHPPSYVTLPAPGTQHLSPAYVQIFLLLKYFCSNSLNTLRVPLLAGVSGVPGTAN